MRGEHFLISSKSVSGSGSLPHARGTRSHFLARMGDPKRLNGHDEEFFAKLMKKPANYKQPNGREVRLYEGYAIIFESKTGEWITMERKAKPKSEWEPI